MSPALPKLTSRQIVLGTLVVLVIGSAFWLLYRFNRVVILLFISFVLGTAAGRLVSFLEQRGLSRRVAALAVYALLLLLVAGFITLLLPMLVDQSVQLARVLPGAYDELHQSMLHHPSDLIWRIGIELPEEPLTIGGGQFQEGDSASLLAGTEQLIDGVLGFAFTIIAVFLLSFYWVIDGQRVKQTLLLTVPYEQRPSARAFVNEAEATIGAFVSGQAALVLIVGLMALVAYLLIGLPYALLLALLAGLLEALPLIGPILATVPAVIVALSQDPVKAIWVVLAMGLIQQLENSLLVPRVMRRSVGIHPLVTLLALMAFGILFGIPGALAAIPLVALIQPLLNRYWFSAEVAEVAPAGRDRLSRLQYSVNEFIADARRLSVGHQTAEVLTDGRYLEEELEDIAMDLSALLAEGNNGLPDGGDA